MATGGQMKVTSTLQNTRTHIPFQQKIAMFFLHHLQAALASFGRFWRTPLASGLTVLVIATALALPAGLYVLVNNVTGLTENWEVHPQISMFMQQQLPEEKVLTVAESLKRHADIALVEYISPVMGWEMFQKASGLGDVAATLPENPLPAVLVITPHEIAHSQQLVTELQQMPGVEFVQLDSAWVERLQGFLKLGQQMVLILEIFLGLAVFLIIGNTIRLMLANRQAEIEIMQWVGATNAFIRRPYLYTGLYYGIIGALVAWAILAGALTFLSVTANDLLSSYNSPFTLIGAGPAIGLNLILLGAAAGWFSAYVVAQYYLGQGEPKK